MTNRFLAGFTIYDESSISKDMLLIDYQFPTPAMKEIKEEVIGMSGSWDFSFMFGKPLYEDRNFTLTMQVFEADYQKRTDYLQEVKKWLYGKPKSTFRCDVYPNYEFNARCVSISEETKSIGYILTLTFTADPYMTHIMTNEKVI